MFPCFVAKTPQIIFLILYTRAIKTNQPQPIRTQWKPVFNSTRRGKCGKNIPMLSQSSYLLAAARKGRASLPMNFWGIELFRFATLLANLSRTSALSLPISALMCLASTLAGLEEEGEEYIGTWGEWGRGWGADARGCHYLWVLLGFLPWVPAVVSETDSGAHSNLAVLCWDGKARPIPS